MRLSLIALIPLTALFSVVHAHSDYSYEAREHIDELATRAFDDSLLTTRQDLAKLSTRDLLDELEDRLQVQRRDEPQEPQFECIKCHGKIPWLTGRMAVIMHVNKQEYRDHTYWRQIGFRPSEFEYPHFPDMRKHRR